MTLKCHAAQCTIRVYPDRTLSFTSWVHGAAIGYDCSGCWLRPGDLARHKAERREKRDRKRVKEGTGGGLGDGKGNLGALVLRPSPTERSRAAMKIAGCSVHPAIVVGNRGSSTRARILAT